MPTNVYHICTAPSVKQAYIFFWGCNFDCQGCMCKKLIWDYMLPEYLGWYKKPQNGLAKPPDKFLDYEELTSILGGMDIEWALMAGQEASLDPNYGRITKFLHDRFKSQNVVLTNAYKLPDLQNTDRVLVSLKAFTEDAHLKYTGKSNRRVLENFVKLSKEGINICAETVLVPGVVDIDEVEKVAKFIAGVDPNIHFQVAAFIPAGDKSLRSPTLGEVEEAVRLSKKHLPKVDYYTGGEGLSFEVAKVFPKN